MELYVKLKRSCLNAIFALHCYPLVVVVTTALARSHYCQRKVFPKGKRNVTIERISEPSEPIKTQKQQTLGVTNKTMIHR